MKYIFQPKARGAVLFISILFCAIVSNAQPPVAGFCFVKTPTSNHSTLQHLVNRKMTWFFEVAHNGAMTRQTILLLK